MSEVPSAWSLKWDEAIEVERREGFSSGEVNCIRCGAELTLFWNGGELDRTTHCGLLYATEHVQTDLVISSLDGGTTTGKGS